MAYAVTLNSKKCPYFPPKPRTDYVVTKGRVPLKELKTRDYFGVEPAVNETGVLGYMHTVNVYERLRSEDMSKVVKVKLVYEWKKTDSEEEPSEGKRSKAPNTGGAREERIRRNRRKLTQHQLELVDTWLRGRSVFSRERDPELLDLESSGIKPSKPIVVFRGLTFTKPVTKENLKAKYTGCLSTGIDIEMEDTEPRSWTTNYCIAGFFSTRLPYGFVIERTVKPKEVLIDLRDLSEKYSQREILVKSGKYKARVVLVSALNPDYDPRKDTSESRANWRVSKYKRFLGEEQLLTDEQMDVFDLLVGNLSEKASEVTAGFI